MPELLVSASNIARVYKQGSVTSAALAETSCEILAGDRIALVGPSGSGKTTLLHLLGGLDAPTVGVITWPALGARETLRPGKVSFVFQMPSLLAPLTVVENVELPLLLLGRPAVDARAAAISALDRFSLRALVDRLPEELSGGQAQRVAVARALACKPRLLLADEPTGQLDHATASRLLDDLMAGLAGTDTALVIATHDQTVAGRMDTRWCMEHGALEVVR